jgi:hypothetical protein
MRRGGRSREEYEKLSRARGVATHRQRVDAEQPAPAGAALSPGRAHCGQGPGSSIRGVVRAQRLAGAMAQRGLPLSPLSLQRARCWALLPAVRVSLGGGWRRSQSAGGCRPAAGRHKTISAGARATSSSSAPIRRTRRRLVPQCAHQEMIARIAACRSAICPLLRGWPLTSLW